jgi:type II secretory ATPase GspE/PulE/Tfp pilus assembly ATPase PilB-like protein
MADIELISNEKNLPPGYMISFAGDPLEVPEKNRKDLLAWDVSTDEDGAGHKFVWILSTKNAFLSNHFMQLVKNAEANGYKVVKKALIESSVLNAMYDRRDSIDKQKATGDESLVVGLFEVILADALAEKVSDIHIEVRDTGGNIRMRKNGEMMEYKPEARLGYDDANNLCSVIYNVLASTKAVSFDPRDCQQAAVNYNINGQELKLRYQSVPAYPDGFDVILRVLPVGRSEDFTPLQKLGYTDQQVQEIVNISSRPVGALVIAGVTGSGKSTTLKNLLMFINATNEYKLKIFTIEDPPEYNIARVTQIPVTIGKDFNAAKMSPFEKPIKACMRGDPDIIMIGEVRDKITGDLTKKAVQSGHQVLTTVHATSALGIIERFNDFGLSRSVLGSPDFLTGLIYQKLLPTVCSHCGIDFNKHIESSSVTKKDLDLYQRIAKFTDPKNYKIKIRSKDGCEHCKGMGISGRSVCAEVIMIDIKMIQYIERGETIPLMIYWRGLSDKKVDSENMRGKTCMEHGFQKVLAGLVSPYDLEASFKPINELLMDDAETVNHVENVVSVLAPALAQLNEDHRNIKNNKNKKDLNNEIELDESDWEQL